MARFEEIVAQKLDQIVMAIRAVSSSLERIDERRRFPVGTLNEQLKDQFKEQRERREEELLRQGLRQSQSLTKATWILALATVGLVTATAVLIIVTLNSGG